MANQFLKTKENITAWLDEYMIKNYILTPDPTYGYTVEVNDNVNLIRKDLSFIPVKFSAVRGDFECSYNKLTSLEFCPAVVDGNFDCFNNKLTSLKFGPHTVGEDFSCSQNQLTSLEFCPEYIMGDMYCNDNQLDTLEFVPLQVKGEFYCWKNPALGKYQDINDFSEILNIQREILIKKEKSLLGHLIAPVALNEKTQSFKI